MNSTAPATRPVDSRCRCSNVTASCHYRYCVATVRSCLSVVLDWMTKNDLRCTGFSWAARVRYRSFTVQHSAKWLAKSTAKTPKTRSPTCLFREDWFLPADSLADYLPHFHLTAVTVSEKLDSVVYRATRARQALFGHNFMVYKLHCCAADSWCGLLALKTASPDVSKLIFQSRS